MITVTLVVCFVHFLNVVLCFMRTSETTWPTRVCAATEMESEPSRRGLATRAVAHKKLQASRDPQRAQCQLWEEYSTSRNIVVVVRCLCVCVLLSLRPAAAAPLTSGRLKLAHLGTLAEPCWGVARLLAHLSRHTHTDAHVLVTFACAEGVQGMWKVVTGLVDVAAAVFPNWNEADAALNQLSKFHKPQVSLSWGIRMNLVRL